MPMTGRIAAALSSILLLAGCGGTTVRVYFLRDGKVAPVARDVSAVAPAAGALKELVEGPTREETAIGLTTAPPGSRAFTAQLAYTESQFAGSRGPPRARSRL